MQGLAFDIAGSGGADNQKWPDIINIADPEYAAPLLNYSGDGLAGNRVGLCLPYRGLVLSFGFEAINTPAARRAVLEAAIAEVTSPPQTEGLTLALSSPQVQVGLPGATVTYTVRVRNTGETGEATAFSAQLASASWISGLSTHDISLKPCSSSVLTITAQIPADTKVDVRNALTLTVRANEKASLIGVITLTAKTPAPVLLVDRHRWYDVQDAYTGALRQAGVSYDVSPASDSDATSPMGRLTLDRLRWYPVVIWFTGYDWYQPVSREEEQRLTSYLDGGGRLMLSSPFYLDTARDNTFARQFLGVITATREITTVEGFGSPGHPLGKDMLRVPLADPFPRAAFRTLNVAAVPADPADVVWRGDHGYAEAVAHSTANRRLVFWAIPFEALPNSARVDMLRRTTGWLGPLGRSTVDVSPSLVQTGQPATVTITMRNDTATPGSLRAVLRATLPPGLEPDLATLSPDLAYTPAERALSYTTDIAAGQSILVSFRVAALPGVTGRLAGSVTLRDEVLGLAYDQPLVLDVEAPRITGTLTVTPGAQSGKPATVSLTVTNDGLVAATGANLLAIPPLGVRVRSGSTAVSGPGSITESASAVSWHGDLPAGGSATITYQVQAPRGILLPRSAANRHRLGWRGRRLGAVRLAAGRPAQHLFPGLL